MLYFPTWQRVMIFVVCALGVLLSIPNLLGPDTLAAWPGFLPSRKVNLGLDLRGGSHLLYEIDLKEMLRERLNNVVDSARTELRDLHTGYTGLEVQGDTVTFTVTEPARLSDVRDMITKKLDRDLVSATTPEGQVTLSFNPQTLADSARDAINRSIEIIRRRIDATGTKEPSIQREGDDRILVQLPGIGDPEGMKKLIGTTAKMTFQMVDPDIAPGEAQQGHAPPGDDVLPSADDPNHPGAPVRYYAVKRRVLVSGDSLTDAQATLRDGEPIVTFKFDSNGARSFGNATRDNVGKLFAIILDGKVIEAPVIREPILGGSGEISGSFTLQSANDLALLLRAGALPAKLTILEERTVGPDLGADSIKAGALASIVGVALVIVFMMVFYGLFGIFADVALCFNLCLMLGTLSLLGATLTLPGIAGIALTLGMAVDANVLIYERIREEVRAGRTMLSSLEAGFKRAFGTIFDSHFTTLVAGILMFFLGSGPVKGFAVTLCLGVFTSLFSALLLTRLQIVTWVRRIRPKAIPI